MDDAEYQQQVAERQAKKKSQTRQNQ